MLVTVEQNAAFWVLMAAIAINSVMVEGMYLSATAFRKFVCMSKRTEAEMQPDLISPLIENAKPSRFGHKNGETF